MNYPSLFSPLKVGPYQLKHRLALAPLTRMRAAKPSLAPRPLNAEYYAQRATPGGLLIAEASPVTETGFGSLGVPGIYTEQQIAGWRLRRRRGARRQRLFDRAIPAVSHQPAHRPIWRLDSEPHALPDGSDTGGGGCVGRRPRRRAAVALWRRQWQRRAGPDAALHICR